MECEIYNPVTKQKLVIKDYVAETYQTEGKPTGNYFFVKLDGLGEVQADRHTLNKVGDGSLYLSSTLAEREIQIEFVLRPDGGKTMEDLRRDVSHILNPKVGVLDLVYKENQRSYKISAVCDHVPTFTTENYLSESAQLVSLTLVASDPFWYDTTPETQYLSVWVPMFEWDLEFPMLADVEQGIELEVLQENGLVELKNTGDEATGMQFLLKATGDVENPEIIRVMEDGKPIQRMKLLLSMKSGEQIRIHTKSGQKRIEKWDDASNKWLNIFNKLSLDSEFIQLDVGENYLRYATEDHPEHLEIKIQYDLKYVGV